jgi:hypothetical protein
VTAILQIEVGDESVDGRAHLSRLEVKSRKIAICNGLLPGRIGCIGLPMRIFQVFGRESPLFVARIVVATDIERDERRLLLLHRPARYGIALDQPQKGYLLFLQPDCCELVGQ